MSHHSLQSLFVFFQLGKTKIEKKKKKLKIEVEVSDFTACITWISVWELHVFWHPMKCNYLQTTPLFPVLSAKHYFDEAVAFRSSCRGRRCVNDDILVRG